MDLQLSDRLALVTGSTPRQWHREHREWFVDCTRLLGDISLYATNLAGATGVQSSTLTAITMRTV
jgi:hypothetical protein